MSTISELMRQVPLGETRRFPAERTPANAPDGAYLEVWMTGEYEWDLMGAPAPREEDDPKPTPAVYARISVPITALDDAPVAFDGEEKDLVDFYTWGSVFFLSDRLYRFLLDRDPGAMESKPIDVHIAGADAPLRFWAVIPARVLDALDPQSTNVEIEHKRVGDSSIRHVRFSGGCRFRADVTAGAPTFVDFYTRRWMWSDALIKDVKAAGFRNIRGLMPCDRPSAEKYNF